MSEEIKPTKTISNVEQKSEDFNMRLALTYAIAFSIGLASGVFLTLSGFFG